MKMDRFEGIIKNLEDFYGKKYTKVFKEELFVEVMYLTAEDLENICKSLMRTDEFMPKLPRFIAVRRESYSTRGHDVKPEREGFPDCRCCGDTGLVSALKKGGYYETFRCDQCAEGRKQPTTISMWSMAYFQTHDMEWKYPFSKEYTYKVALYSKTIPGFLKEMVRRQSSGQKMTGSEEDFSFLNEEPWCNLERQDIDTTQLTKELI